MTRGAGIKVYAILDNIRSAYNVGSVFRTADGAGVSKIFLTGLTPCPHTNEKFKTRARRDLEKTALGAEKFVPWEYHKQTWRLIEKLKRQGVQIIALEQTKNSIPYYQFKPTYPLCLIVGNEVTGISKSILKRCDAIIAIPMRGKKESLNVAVAFGIAVYSLTNQQKHVS